MYSVRSMAPFFIQREEGVWHSPKIWLWMIANFWLLSNWEEPGAQPLVDLGRSPSVARRRVALSEITAGNVALHFIKLRQPNTHSNCMEHFQGTIGSHSATKVPPLMQRCAAYQHGISVS